MITASVLKELNIISNSRKIVTQSKKIADVFCNYCVNVRPSLYTIFIKIYRKLASSHFFKRQNYKFIYPKLLMKKKLEINSSIK